MPNLLQRLFGNPNPNMFRTPGFNPGGGGPGLSDPNGTYGQYDPAGVSWPMSLPQITRGALGQQNNGAPMMNPPTTPGFNPNAGGGPGMPSGMNGPGGSSPGMVGSPAPMPQAPGPQTPQSPPPMMTQPAPNPAPMQSQQPPPSPRPSQQIWSPPQQDTNSDPSAAADSALPAPSSMLGNRMPAAPQVNMNFPPAPADVPKQVTDDMMQDYTGQRNAVMSLPRKQDYEPSLAKKILGGLGTYGASLASASPLWYARAGAPQLAKLSKDVTDKPYADAMQKHNEEAQIAQGLYGTSTGMAAAQDKLATGQTSREVQRANAELLRQKPEMARNAGMVNINSEQARLLGMPEETIAQAEESGIPIQVHRSTLNKALDTAGKEKVAQIRSEAYVGVKTAHDQVVRDVTEANNKTKADIAAAVDERKRLEGEANRLNKLQVQGAKNAGTTRNTDERVKLQRDVMASQDKMRKLKTTATQSANNTYNRGMQDAQKVLKDTVSGKTYTPEELEKAIATDPSNVALHGMLSSYLSTTQRITQQRDELMKQLEQEYGGVMNPQGGGATSPASGGMAPSAPAPQKDAWGQPVK